MDKKFNRFDYAIILLLGLLAFGLLGGAYQPVRLVAIMLFPLALSCLSECSGRLVKSERVFIAFVICFCGYALVSLLWTSDRIVGLKEAVYYPIHIALFLELVLFSKKANQPLLSLMLGWIVAAFLTFPIALQELVFDKHLVVSKLEEGTVKNLGTQFGGAQAIRFASATFGNYNAYNLFLVWCIVSMCSALLMARGRLMQGILLGGLAFASGIIVINASRGGIVCIGIVLLVFLCFVLRTPVWGRKLLIFVGLVGGVACFSYFSSALLLRISSRLLYGGGFSDEGRFYLIKKGVGICCDTLGMGTGIGSMVEAYYTRVGGSILAAHNVLIEIVVQYGVIVSGFFVFALVILLLEARKHRSATVRFFVFAGVLCAPIWGVINSVYWTNPGLWAFLATLCAVVGLCAPHEFKFFRSRSF